MKSLKTYLLGLVCLFSLSTAICAQTVNWVTVANEGTGNNKISTSANVTFRFGVSTGTTSTGVNCATANCWSPSITTTTPWNNFTVYYTGFSFPDPAPGLAKNLQVLQTTSVQTFSYSVNNAAPITETVAALPKTYAPITFGSGVAYKVTVANVPSGSSLFVLTVTLTDSNNSTNVVTFTCTYGTTSLTPASGSTPASLVANENCVPK